jgi:hypothetical protein
MNGAAEAATVVLVQGRHADRSESAATDESHAVVVAAVVAVELYTLAVAAAVAVACASGIQSPDPFPLRAPFPFPLRVHPWNRRAASHLR